MNGRDKRRKRARRPFPSRDLCWNCGEPGPHFVPPSMGETGFYSCKKKDEPKP